VPFRLTAVFVAVAAAASGAAWAAAPAGRLLYGVLAAGAAAEAARSGRPTLVADRAGFTLLHGWRLLRHPWADVAAVGTLRPPASGRRARRSSNALEIDLGERLLVVAGYRLGAPAAEVAAALAALRAGARSDWSSGGC
jgi:hypothetical protein